MSSDAQTCRERQLGLGHFLSNEDLRAFGLLEGLGSLRAVLTSLAKGGRCIAVPRDCGQKLMEKMIMRVQVQPRKNARPVSHSEVTA
jgi:hypothetical protein